MNTAINIAVQIAFANIIPLGLMALSVAISVVLFALAKRNMAKSARQASERYRVIAENCRRLEDLILGMGNRLKEAEERAAVLVAPPTARSSLNMNKRAQATKMLWRGDRPDQIAAALCLPQNEIDLLLKVQKAAGG
jgi:hypothetical protein